MTIILQQNGGWRMCSKIITSLQILEDELQKIEWNNNTMLLHDYKFSPTFGVMRCEDHHFQNVFKTILDFIIHLKNEHVFADINQVFFIDH